MSRQEGNEVEQAQRLPVMRCLRGMAQRLLLSALAVGFLLAVTGCGGSDDRRDREEVKQVLTVSMNAAHAGDQAKACSLYTPAYVREVMKEHEGLKLMGDTCEEVVRALNGVLKQLTPDPNPRVTDVRVFGDKATARMEIETHFGPAATKVFAAREDGNWKITHDQDFPDDTQSPGL